MVPQTIKTISEETRAWLQFFLGRLDSNTHQEEEALSSLIDTLSQTVRYIGNITKIPESKSQETEESLSSMWKETAKQVRPFNQELAVKCFFKGIYWADNERLTESEIVELGIKIEDMQNHVLSAIKGI